MRRPVIAGVVLGAVLAVMPLASRAATAPSVTLLSPSANHVTNGDLVVRWSYSGFYRTTPVDIEAAMGSGPFQRLARAAVDDGTPGYYGSHTVSTTSLADGADYTIRLVMPTNRTVTSSVAPITIDNTGPTSTVTAAPVAEGGPAVAITSDVSGTATDALSTVESVTVTFTTPAGSKTERQATCDCGASSVTWSTSTDGLLPGQYTVSAVAVDALGNVGEAGSADMLVVGRPEDPTPAVVATVNGVVETASTTVGTVVETVTGIVNNPPTFDDTTGPLLETVTGLGGTAGDAFATVTATYNDLATTANETIAGTGGGS